MPSSYIVSLPSHITKLRNNKCTLFFDQKAKNTVHQKMALKTFLLLENSLLIKLLKTSVNISVFVFL